MSEVTWFAIGFVACAFTGALALFGLALLDRRVNGPAEREDYEEERQKAAFAQGPIPQKIPTKGT